jgi:hypothetical protein
MEIRCLRKEISHFSSVISEVLLPISVMKFNAASLTGPNVSMATGTNSSDDDRCLYLSLFLTAAISAAPPADEAAACRYELARVSATVTSQATHLPPCHGMRVRPSGRFPSERNRPGGSFIDGILALARARHIISLRL